MRACACGRGEGREGACLRPHTFSLSLARSLAFLSPALALRGRLLLDRGAAAVSVYVCMHSNWVLFLASHLFVVPFIVDALLTVLFVCLF